MTDETTTPAAEPKWYQKPGVLAAIATVVALAVGGFGYTMSTGDQSSLVGGVGLIVAGVIQVVHVVKNVLGSKK